MDNSITNDMMYKMIFKRKSFHIFKDVGKIEDSELRRIEESFKSFVPLDEDIKVGMKIVPQSETTCKRGAEYCVLLYSEERGNYLQNIGYIGEQLDLYLASMDIGALWFGIGKTEETLEGLSYVIMIAISKMPGDKFRKDMFKSKRKPLGEVWDGNLIEGVTDIVRFAPSACNTQPWKVHCEIGDEGKVNLDIYRYKKPGKKGIMPAAKVTYYNRIDIGIFLLFLDVCLKHKGVVAERVLMSDFEGDDEEFTMLAKYRLISC